MQDAFPQCATKVAPAIFVQRQLAVERSQVRSIRRNCRLTAKRPGRLFTASYGANILQIRACYHKAQSSWKRPLDIHHNITMNHSRLSQRVNCKIKHEKNVKCEINCTTDSRKHFSGRCHPQRHRKCSPHLCHPRYCSRSRDHRRHSRRRCHHHWRHRSVQRLRYRHDCCRFHPELRRSRCHHPCHPCLWEQDRKNE